MFTVWSKEETWKAKQYGQALLMATLFDEEKLEELMEIVQDPRLDYEEKRRFIEEWVDEHAETRTV